ncbi:MAG: hypothetical protein RSP_05010 [Rhodanobacter sp.]
MSSIALPFPSFTPTRPETKARRRGFGLLEVILVFAIVIGAAAVVFTVFGFAHASSEASNIVDETNLIAGNLRTSPWAMSHDFTNVPETGQWIPGVFPNNWNQNGQAFSPETGATAYVGGGTTSGLAPNQFWVLINYVPVSNSECARIGAELGAQYDDVWFAASGPTDIGKSICDATAPCKVDMAKLNSWCGGSDQTDTPGTVGFQAIGHN